MDYIFSEDKKYLDRFKKLKLAAKFTNLLIDFSRNFIKSFLLGRAVKVTDKQFSGVYKLLDYCVKKLKMENMPELFIIQESTMNALTLQTETNSLIVLNSMVIDHFKEDELKFLLGHECGHIQNDHGIYHALAKLITLPIFSFQLRYWLRASEITADRAGYICVGNLTASISSLIKLALGAQKLYKNINIDEYLKQLEELKQSYGKLQEILFSHPFLPKRVEALKLYAKIKKKQDKEEIDRKVKALLKIF